MMDVLFVYSVIARIIALSSDTCSLYLNRNNIILYYQPKSKICNKIEAFYGMQHADISVEELNRYIC